MIVKKLDRFRRAQAQSYPYALRQVQQGYAMGHWIWYIFPQIAGLNMSSMSCYYALSSLDDAKLYMTDSELGQHLVEITHAVLDSGVDDPVKMFGRPESERIRSSMTLFELTGADPVFAEALDALYGGERDQKTLDILAKQEQGN